MKHVAIIPARGGSKRLPGKNIIPISGKPAISYPIEAALKARIFDRVIVSTEDEEIKDISKNCGAEVFDRPEELAGDKVGVVDVCMDVLKKLGEDGISPDSFCCIYATAVFLQPSDLIKSCRILEQHPEGDVVMGVSKYNLQPDQAMVDEGGVLKPRWPDLVRLQSQDKEGQVASNGTLYWAETKKFLRQKSFYVEKMMGYEIPWMRAIDIDTPEDLENARLLAPLFLTPK